MPSLSPDALSFVAQLVRAHDPASLYEALRIGLCPLFTHHSIAASFNILSHGGMSIWSSVPRPDHPPAYWERRLALEPAIPWLRERIGCTVCTVSDILSAKQLERHPYFLEFMKPEGWRYALAFVVWDHKEIVGFVAINRAAEHGGFTRAERTLAATLHPFLVAVWERLATNTVHLAQERILQTFPVAVLVYSPRAHRVTYYNRAATEALARWRGDEARTRPRAVTARWVPGEILAACDAMPLAGSEVRCLRTGMRARLSRVDPRAHFTTDAVLIVIDPAEDASAPSPRWLQAVGRLSLAEQLVATEAARGLSNAEIARVLGKSPFTVKKQLEAVFAKAEIKTRAQLAALYGGLAARRRTDRRRGERSGPARR